MIYEIISPHQLIN